MAGGAGAAGMAGRARKVGGGRWSIGSSNSEPLETASDGVGEEGARGSRSGEAGDAGGQGGREGGSEGGGELGEEGHGRRRKAASRLSVGGVDGRGFAMGLEGAGGEEGEQRWQKGVSREGCPGSSSMVATRTRQHGWQMKWRQGRERSSGRPSSEMGGAAPQSMHVAEGRGRRRGVAMTAGRGSVAVVSSGGTGGAQPGGKRRVKSARWRWAASERGAEEGVAAPPPS